MPTARMHLEHQMANTYVSALFHCVFSTKNRERTIKRDLRERLYPYMGGIARENDMRALAIGGTDDHAHLLLSLPKTMAISKAMQLIKGGSSKFVHETIGHRFEWQEGYGAFSVSVSAIDETIAYINSQEEHHRTRTFQEEYIAFLKKHGIEYDERYVFG